MTPSPSIDDRRPEGQSPSTSLREPARVFLTEKTCDGPHAAGLTGKTPMETWFAASLRDGLRPMATTEGLPPFRAVYGRMHCADLLAAARGFRVMDNPASLPFSTG